ncbi:MAG: Ig-like domain-containing protein, partial [Bryobacteraceae bacterium]
MFFTLFGCLHAATPVPVSVTPAVIGASQTFSLTVTETAGVQDIGVVNLLINNYLDGGHACYLAYSSPQNVLYLVNDAGNNINGIVLNGSGTLSNSQCTISGAGSSASGVGTTLTLTLTITFKQAAFSGNKVIWAAARDIAENSSGWRNLGVALIASLTPTYPSLVTISPQTGTGSGSLFSLQFRDATSNANFRTVQFLLNTAIDGRSACYLGYDRINNLLYLVDDNGGSLRPAVIPALGGSSGSGTVSNSQCTVKGATSAVHTTATDLFLDIDLTFSSAFNGPKTTYLGAQTANGGNTGWVAGGGWMVGQAGVDSVYPADQSTGIATNSGVVLRFTTRLKNPNTGALKLFQGATPIAGSVNISIDGYSAVFVPTTPLGPLTTYTVQANGFQSLASGTVPSTFVSAFTTGALPDTAYPTLVSYSPATTNPVPVNAPIVLRFNKRINPAGQFFSINFQTPATGLPVLTDVQVSADGLTLSVVPLQPLAVSQNFGFSTNSLTDIFGHPIYASLYFTTSFAADSQGPRLLRSVPTSGDTGIPINAQVSLAFDEATSWPSTVSGLTLTAAGNAVSTTITRNSSGDVLTVVPSALLQPNTTYTASFAGITDSVGNPIQNGGSFSFTTGPGADLSSPTVLSANPPYNATLVGTNAPIRFRVSKRLSAGIGTVSLSRGSGLIAAGTLSLSPDGLIVTFTPSDALLPNTPYSVLGSFTDITGTGFYIAYNSWQTGAGPDTVAPQVIGVTPPQGAVGVPVNARITVQLSEAADPTSLNATSIRLLAGGSPVAGSASGLYFSPA